MAESPVLDEMPKKCLKFRKKPVVVEAFQMTEEARFDDRDWPEWLKAALGEPFDRIYSFSTATLRIISPEGSTTVSPGDWIIRGIKGELYPCKADIFEATYKPVTDND